LFDLALRLAAGDDGEHEGRPLPLRLATPSPAESLTIILRVVSDHSDWLSPIAIAPRYRFVLQHIIRTFHCPGATNFLDGPFDDRPDDCIEGFILWSKRASFLIDATKIANRGRMALIATQFMMLLCSQKNNGARVASFPSRQPHFYARLQLNKSSRFWTEIDESAANKSSNVMARVLDRNFAMRFLLPLTFQCTLLLAASSMPSPQNGSISVQTQDSHSALSLVTIMASVLDVLANNEVLRDCVHIGWAVQILALSLGYFVFGEDYHVRTREAQTLSDCNTSSNSVWEHLSHRLNNLYFSVWGRDWHRFIGTGRTQLSAKKHIYYETIGRDCNGGIRMAVLLPSLDIFFTSLIKFACSLRSEPDGVEDFCQFIANVLFDRYAQALHAYPKSGCDDLGISHEHGFSLVSDWIGALASNLQEMVCRQIFYRGEHAKEASTETVLDDLITPLLKALHSHIMSRMLRSRPPRLQNKKDSCCYESSPQLVASIFVRLYKQEVEPNIKKPTSAMARRCRIYRKCIEELFLLTPHNLLLASHGYPALTEHAAEILTEIWNQFGRFDLSRSIFIMVAAALHVDASSKEYALLLSRDDRSQQVCLLSQDDLSQHLSLRLEQLYKNFTAHAKNCIIKSIEGGNSANTNLHNKINNLVWGVRRQLTLRRDAEGALGWWNEISLSLLKKSNYQALDHKESDVTSLNILKACSALQSNLSAISAISHRV
jgi:hypothetical protein